MKLLILILLTLPQLIFAGWVKEGNGFISEDSLVGQKRFLPEENAVIVESKDYVLKFDLTTGEIIKRIDIIETDTTYSFQLFNGSGQQLLARQVKSSFGFVFEPVQLIDLNNGVYYYTITNNNSLEFSGKLVVVE